MPSTESRVVTLYFFIVVCLAFSLFADEAHPHPGSHGTFGAGDDGKASVGHGCR